MMCYLISYFRAQTNESPFSICTVLIDNAPSQSEAIVFFYQQYPGTDMIAISEIEDPNVCVVDDIVDYDEAEE